MIGKNATAPEFLTPTEAADLLRKTRKAVYAMVSRGKLPGATRVHSRLLVNKQILLQWLDQQVVTASAKE